MIEDAEVLMRERASGLYRLSAYHLAVFTSETPVAFVLPTMFDVIVYWMGGLMNTAQHFVLHWLILMLTVCSAQVRTAVCSHMAILTALVAPGVKIACFILTAPDVNITLAASQIM